MLTGTTTPRRTVDRLSRLRELRDGHPLSAELAAQLLTCDDDLLPELLAAARALKEQFRPGVVTYSRKVFIPLTNLCRDYCGYCTYRRDPGDPGAHTMTPDEVLAVAQQGEKLGCTEALFSLGDKPEMLFPEMRATLRRLGYRSTLHYLEAMCELVLRETRLLPHANPGLLSGHWIERLRASNPSLGLMLESTSTHLPEAHPAGRTPDKLPASRLKTIEDAGRLGVPFTTGILIGIGETMHDRVESLLAIKALHERYGHIQEVIIQNFRAKPPIPMASVARARHRRHAAHSRCGASAAGQHEHPSAAESHARRLRAAARCRINDWGGVSPLTPDYINPEAPWPHLLDSAAPH